MGQRKTRPVTEMGRLVTRQQLQSAADQIGQHILGGLARVEDNMDARLSRIEQHLGLDPIEQERAVRLVGPDAIPDGGTEARSLPGGGYECREIDPKVPA
jgi:hypothetical protein